MRIGGKRAAQVDEPASVTLAGRAQKRHFRRRTAKAISLPSSPPPPSPPRSDRRRVYLFAKPMAKPIGSRVSSPPE